MSEQQQRRWYQFSLRRMLVAFTSLALVLGLFAALTAKGRAQRAAVETIRRLGGRVHYIGYDMPRPLPGIPMPDQSLYARQVRKWLGKDHVDAVVEVQLANATITDHELAQITSLSELEALNLFGTTVSDSGVPSLKKLSRLKYLRLSYTDVSEAGIAELQEALPNCRIDNSL